VRLYTTLWNINIRKTNNNIEHMGKWKKQFKQTLLWMICMTPNCVSLTQSSVMRIIHSNVSLCFFSFTTMFVIIVIGLRSYFIYISQGSVKTYLWCGGKYYNHIFANCPLSVPVKIFWKSVNNWRRYGQKESAMFFIGPPSILKKRSILCCQWHAITNCNKHNNSISAVH